MQSSVDAVGVDMQPVRGTTKAYIPLFVLLVIIICLLFANMFVGVVISTYNKQKEFISFNTLLENN